MGEEKMDNCILLSRDAKSVDVGVKEYSFAREINSSFWDSLNEQEIDEEKLLAFEMILDYIKEDY